MLKVQIVDRNNLKGFLKMFPKAVKTDAATRGFMLANELRNNVIRAMKSTPRSILRSYKRGKRKIHHPSAPGFAPAVDSGDYVRSIQTRALMNGGETYVFGAPYWEYLEEGTDKMAARPVWEREIEKLDIGSEMVQMLKGRFG